jgi:hypothetical protein
MYRLQQKHITEKFRTKWKQEIIPRIVMKSIKKIRREKKNTNIFCVREKNELDATLERWKNILINNL